MSTGFASLPLAPSSDRQQRLQPGGRSRFLALLVPCLERDAAVRPGRIYRALVVLTEKRTRRSAGDDDAFPFLLYLADDLIDRLAGMMRIGVDEPRLPDHVQVLDLDDEAPLAARATFVALKL